MKTIKIDEKNENVILTILQTELEQRKSSLKRQEEHLKNGMYSSDKARLFLISQNESRTLKISDLEKIINLFL